MKSTIPEQARRRGRPHKFGRPSQLVTVTLPADVVRKLRSIDRDLARAIVQMFTSMSADETASAPQLDAELLSIADRHSLIVVNSSVIRDLPGVNIVPLDGTRAFLALDAGRGASDLELAVIDRLDETLDAREQQALKQLRQSLKVWRHDPALRFHGRAIIVVEALPASRGRRHSAPGGSLRNRQPTRHRAGASAFPRPAAHAETSAVPAKGVVRRTGYLVTGLAGPAPQRRQTPAAAP